MLQRFRCWWRGHKWGPMTVAAGKWTFERLLVRECRACGRVSCRTVEGHLPLSQPSPSAVVEQLLDDAK